MRPGSAARATARTAARRAGYTLVEVLAAVGILAGGSMGLMALHQASIRGNLQARQLGTATTIASRWIERLERDAAAWEIPITATDTTGLDNTTYLQLVSSTPGVWFVPDTSGNALGESHAFDHFGRDYSSADPAPPEYCTNLRLDWVYFGRALRADVRVWYRRRTVAGTTAYVIDCASEVPAASGDPVHFVHASTVLRYNPRGQP